MLADGDVAAVVGCVKTIEGEPASDVVPLEGRLDHVDRVLRLFHHREVDGNLRRRGVLRGKDSVDVGLAPDISDLRNGGGDLWLERCDLADDRRGLPRED